MTERKPNKAVEINSRGRRYSGKLPFSVVSRRECLTVGRWPEVMIRRDAKELFFREKRRWVIDSQPDPVGYLRWLQEFVPQRAILYFEGVGIAKDIAALFRIFAARGPVPVMKNTLFPRPRCFHVRPTKDLFDALICAAHADRCGQVCEHFHVYRGKTMLIYGHDAFTDNRTLVSERFPKKAIGRLKQFTGVKARFEELEEEGEPGAPL